jgi:hypothetical protein
MTDPKPYPSGRQVAQRMKDYLVLLEDESRVGEKAWHDALSAGAGELHSMLCVVLGLRWTAEPGQDGGYSILARPGSRPIGESLLICDGLTRVQAETLAKAHNDPLT